MTLAVSTGRKELWSAKGKLNLVNLQNREDIGRLGFLELPGINDPDPDIFVITRVDWRDVNPEYPILPRLPRLLSILETLNGTKDVPKEVYLDSLEGISVYLRSGTRMSDIPNDVMESISFLNDIIHETKTFFEETAREVEEFFWKVSRKKGFSRDIVDRIAQKEKGFDTEAIESQFYSVMRSYFSVRFRIHQSESCLRAEV